MPYREPFAEGDLYHIFNRGAWRRRIFLDDENYYFFIRLLRVHLGKHQIGLVCYCLMPNHFHLLLLQDGTRSISRFVQGLLSAYVQAFNKQQNRTGTLFEGRFKHVHVDTQEYLLHLIRYIHLNPVRAGLVAKPEEWAFSDYRLWTQPPFPKVTGDWLDDGTFGKLPERIGRYREMLGIPGPSEYEKFVGDYNELVEADSRFRKYLFDQGTFPKISQEWPG